jgi:hypothetical protein
MNEPNAGLQDGYPYEFIEPGKWADTPVTRPMNIVTGNIKGDDSGYRDVKTYENGAPFVEPTEVAGQPYYDGVDDFGEKDESLKIPGGVKRYGQAGEVVVGREAVVRAIEAANRAIQANYPGEAELRVAEIHRDKKRQMLGWRWAESLYRGKDGIVEPTTAEIMKYGKQADGFFSYAKPVERSQGYQEAKAEVMNNREVMEVLKDMAGSKDPQALEAFIKQYIAYQANRGIMKDVPLSAKKNVHATGAADIGIYKPDGTPMGFTPFDFPGFFSMTDMLEDETNWPKFREFIAQDAKLTRYYTRLGYPDAAQIPDSLFIEMRRLHRIRIHALEAVGGVYYSLGDEGEHWHYDFGRIVKDPTHERTILWEEPGTEHLGEAGSTGWTVQHFGRQGTAAWDGDTAAEVIDQSTEFYIDEN